MQPGVSNQLGPGKDHSIALFWRSDGWKYRTQEAFLEAYNKLLAAKKSPPPVPPPKFVTGTSPKINGNINDLTLEIKAFRKPPPDYFNT
jgi:hypothetical protein